MRTGGGLGNLADKVSIATAISRRLEQTPDRVLVRYLGNDGRETAALTCAAIDGGGRRVAAGLAAAGLGGRRALLVMETGPDFLMAMIGCLYSGVIAIPASEPRPGASLDRLEEIAAGSKAAALIVSRRVSIDLARRVTSGSVLDKIPVVEVATLAAAPPLDDCAGFSAEPSVPVIVQYTSGSTRAPRGVVLDSACILANVAVVTRAFGVGQSDEPEMIVNWMPHYHDMGLIGKIVTPLVNGFETVHMSPLAFVQRPSRWLTVMSQYRGTVSGAPAFAYDLCAERVSDDVIDTLDLSAWKTAFCGAEPVFASTLDAFRRRFARAGLRPSTVFTCYGLAESTLYAAGTHGPEIEPSPDAGKRAPCWLDPVSRATIRIVGQEDRPVADGEEGEIWLTGASIASGYLDDEEATLSTFRCRLDPDDGRDYVRTGTSGGSSATPSPSRGGSRTS